MDLATFKKHKFAILKEAISLLEFTQMLYTADYITPYLSHVLKLLLRAITVNKFFRVQASLILMNFFPQECNEEAKLYMLLGQNGEQCLLQR